MSVKKTSELVKLKRDGDKGRLPSMQIKGAGLREGKRRGIRGEISVKPKCVRINKRD